MELKDGQEIKFYLICIGDSTLDGDQNSDDSKLFQQNPLSVLGELQAKRLSNFFQLNCNGVTHVICSSLKGSVDTANIFISQCNLTSFSCNIDFNELDFKPDSRVSSKAKPFIERVCDQYCNIISKHESGDKIAIICHPFVIRTILSEVIFKYLGESYSDCMFGADRFDIDEASFTEVTLTSKGWQINCINNTVHLSTRDYTSR
jgi:broad specificity phosphatase PhoE